MAYINGNKVLDVVRTVEIEPTLQEKTVTPTKESQEVTPDQNYNGLSKVTINGDNDLVAGNIKKDVTIFGVTGNLEQGITPSGKKYITDTTENDVSTYEKAQVQDANLVAGNIKKDVSILGVLGTYEASGGGGVWTEVNVGNGNYTVWVIFDGQYNIMHATATITFETDNQTYTSSTDSIEYYCFKGVSGGQYIKTKVSANDIGSNYYNRILITPNVVGGDVCLKCQQNANIDTDSSYYIPVVSNQGIAVVFFKWYEG